MIAQLDADYFDAGYGRVARRLASYALFEGRPHSTRGQWYNPVVKGLMRSITALPGAANVRRPIFIVGLGRSGTTILGKILSLHRGVGFLNEPKLIWAMADPRTDVCGDYVASGGKFRLTPDDVTVGAERFLRRAYARYLALVGARRVVDKYPELVFRIEYVRKLFPDAIVLFLTRNGLDACSSIARWDEQKRLHVNDGVEDWWGRGDKKWNYLWNELVVADPQYASIAALGEGAFDAVNRAALEWILNMREGLTEEMKQPGTMVRLRYEDLLENPADFVGRLLEACELEQDGAITSYIGAQIGPQTTYSELQLNPMLEELFVSTMLALGYYDRLQPSE